MSVLLQCVDILINWQQVCCIFENTVQIDHILMFFLLCTQPWYRCCHICNIFSKEQHGCCDFLSYFICLILWYKGIISLKPLHRHNLFGRAVLPTFDTNECVWLMQRYMVQPSDLNHRYHAMPDNGMWIVVLKGCHTWVLCWFWSIV